ncbi:MAG: DNA repair protein RecO [Bacilli bacterium]|nr:DNA repair protein RecO [Bacilli bacterium]
MKIIVLKANNYKEKDGIIDAISEEEKMSFLARSLFDSKSKNLPLSNPLTIADVTTSSGKYKYPVINSSSILMSSINPHADLKYMATLMMITEIINNLLSDEEQVKMFKEIEECLMALKTSSNPYEIGFAFLAKALKNSGYDFEVNHCVKCGGKKSIVAFSFEEGGYICQNCYDESAPLAFNKKQMSLIRQAFLLDDYSLSFNELGETEVLLLFDKFFAFIYDSYGYRLKSKDLFK